MRATDRQQTETPPDLEIERSDRVLCIRPRGVWRLAWGHRLEEMTDRVRVLDTTRAEIDLTGLSALDTVGAWLLYRIECRLSESGITVSYKFGNDLHRRIVEQIRKSDVPCDIEPEIRHPVIELLEDIGQGTLRAITTFGALLSFIGAVLMRVWASILDPRRIRLTPLVHQMEVIGVRSLPIVGLICFLIGAVMVNQGAVQLKRFGAEILVVDLVSFGVLRELGVLLTAVILAGRSGSAFAAQIGSMVLHEEVDAMRALGIHPIDVLVLPRLVAMVLVLPLLTFFADIMGLLGGALMAWISLGITPDQFITRLGEMELLTQLYIGLIKSVFFAGVISFSGCFHGLSVSGTAESVGQHTTAAVVESIFLVIVLDAMFAIFFTTIGW